jgi:hypothetical protein
MQGTLAHPALWLNDVRLDTIRLAQQQLLIDGFVKSPISALRFIPLSLRRTARTPHSTGFARLELGLCTKPSGKNFFKAILIDWDESWHSRGKI